MSARPWMPMYWGDYLADTGHLSTLQHGAYLLLIAHYWRHECLPIDEQLLARVVRMDSKQWAENVQILRSFFQENWIHTRIEKELEKSRDISSKRRASALQKHTQPQPQPQRDKKVCDVSNLNFEDFRRSYPKRKGSQGWPSAQKHFESAVKSGCDPRQIVESAKKFATSVESAVGTEFVPMAETWMRKKSWLEFLPTQEEIERAKKTEEFLASRGYGKPENIT